jgi:hypothetical protein
MLKNNFFLQNGKWNGIKILFCFLFFLCPFLAKPQQDSSTHQRFSLLTIGVGDEIYASFGHTGIRVVDSVGKTDLVYNWGTFDGFQKDFELKFMRGKLLYYASVETFADCYGTYVHEQRGIEEQQLFLTEAQKRELLATLKENLQEENKYYKYDFLYDNCSTRPRDVFKRTFGKGFQYGSALGANYHPTFRDEIHHYLAHLPWERFGIDLLLGSPVDKKMSNEDAMFLPDYLRNGIAGAMLAGKPVSTEAQPILKPAKPIDDSGIQPYWIMWLVCFITGACLLIPSSQKFGTILTNVFILISGLLGCLMLFMWFGTDHQTCRDNYNLLWALPTNVIVPFVRRSRLKRYALVAIILILVALPIHFFGVQAFALTELVPVWLLFLLYFGIIYKSREK